MLNGLIIFVVRWFGYGFIGVVNKHSNGRTTIAIKWEGTITVTVKEFYLLLKTYLNFYR